ncbi:MAG: hypothetical protein LBT01_08080 [Spirochaetaceae bacterium]|nr:hypothetical protein [Spirochaetaceae bacterium]
MLNEPLMKPTSNGRKFIRTWAICCLCALFVACSGQIEGTFTMTGHGDLKLSAELQPKTAALIRKIASGTGGAPSQALLNGAALSKGFSALNGIEKAVFVNKTPNLVDGQLAITRIDELIAEQTGAGTGTANRRFITWEQNAEGGRALIYLDRASAPAVVASLSETLYDYLSTVMAPVSTGEELSLSDYLELVKAVYGEDIAQEIAASRLRLRLKFPAKIGSMLSSAQGGTSSGANAAFDIPLVELLVLEKPFFCDIKWGKQP